MPREIDLAKRPGMQLTDLERLLDDIRYQPSWRVEADRAADYYDGRQLDAETIKAMRERGQPILIHNLIAPAINGVLGLEAKTRADWMLVANDGSGLEVVEALNQELNEAARIAMADRAISNAHGAQIKSGLGWVEVGRNNDPFDYRYRTNYIHRREIFWDWHAQRDDLKDARWLLRRKWLDVDELHMAFPMHKELINQVADGWSRMQSFGGAFGEDENEGWSADLLGAYTDQTSSAIALEEWWDSNRRRALTYELYYRVWQKKPVLKLETGDNMEFDQNNRLHTAALAAGRAEVVVAPFSKMRLSYFIGPHRVADLDSPHPHNLFPYIPFWGYREDRTGIPYGMIRGMMPAQDEINHRRSKLTQLLNKLTLIKDKDAVLEMSDDAVLDELYRGDGGVVNLNPNRKNKDANSFRLLDVSTVASQQFSVMQEAQKMIQDVAGVYSAFLGQESGAKSGVAIDSLVEQGTTTLAEINDNYQLGRTLVGELLLAHIVDDIGDTRHEVKLNVNKPHATKVVVLNDRRVDGASTQVTNAVKRTKTRVVLSDVHSTPGYRQQMARNLMNLAASLPEQFSAALLDLIIELGDFPNRDEVLKRIRKVSGQGINPEDLTDEERQQMEAQAQMENALQEMQFKEIELKLEKLAAEAREIASRAAERESKTESVELDREKSMAEIERIRAEVKEIVTDVAAKRQALKHGIVAQLNGLTMRK